VRLRDIAARTGITERTADSIVTDLTEAEYVAKHKDGRRNRYQITSPLFNRSGTSVTERGPGSVLPVHGKLTSTGQIRAKPCSPGRANWPSGGSTGAAVG
jgi:hypothetical protein